jgi:hypothetical protein
MDKPLVSFIRWTSGETWEWHPADNAVMLAHIIGHALKGNTIANYSWEIKKGNAPKLLSAIEVTSRILEPYEDALRIPNLPPATAASPCKSCSGRRGRPHGYNAWRGCQNCGGTGWV